MMMMMMQAFIIKKKETMHCGTHVWRVLLLLKEWNKTQKNTTHDTCSVSCSVWAVKINFLTKCCAIVCNLYALSWILFRFAVLRDPAGWLSVNPVKGTVNTTGTLDRESPHVHNNRYSAVFMATDNGKSVISCYTITQPFVLSDLSSLK